MLFQALRLKRPEDFQTVRRRGKRQCEADFTLYALPNGLAHSRYGIVVSKRIGTAVIRNRVKRRLRAAIARWLPELARGYDCVVVMNPSAAQATYQMLEAVLGHAFQKLHLFADGKEVS
jgi:ribonuclease P protein component